MSKILKNQTGSPILISDVGISVPASPATYTINVTDYLLWAASSNVITQIGNGNIIVSDGAVNLSISDGTDLIKGQFPSSIRITNGTNVAAVSAGLRLSVDGSGVTQPVSVAGSVAVTGPLTDTQLRAVAVPVSGTFFQTTQPVSAASLPLPTGASTSTLQTAANASLNSIDIKIPALGQALMASSQPVVIASNQSTLPISAASLPLPTGASTSALQTTANTSLSSILANQTNRTQFTKLTDGTNNALVTSAGRLQVDSAVTTNPNTAKPGANYSIVTASPNLTLAPNASPATTMFTYTGSGRVFYAMFKFNNANIMISLWKEGVQQFEFNLLIVDNFKDILKTTSALPYLYYNDTTRQVAITFPNGYEFSTSFSIRARANDTNTGRVLSDYIIGIEKDS